ncbi:MAG TPA: PPC domain-containing protein [Mycobacteriales bacterium]|nr:PPC domain-containing protein [Mycobacteriales bacterium]
MNARRVSLVAGFGLLAAAVGVSSAATPSSSTLAIPSPGAAASQVTWDGTVPIAADSGGCDQGSGVPNPLADDTDLSITTPSASFYDTATSTVTIKVTNTDSTDLDILVLDSSGNTVTSGTGSDTASETATFKDAKPGTYTFEVCVGTPGTAATVPYKAVVTAASTAKNSAAVVLSNLVDDKAFSFTAGTVVDPVLFGGEPGVHVDPTQGTRSYVDWPVSSRTNVGVLYRSQDDGLSYQKRYADPSDLGTAGAACTGRQVPICIAGGGGDTNTSIDPTNGKLIYTSQVALANEAVGVSSDHGETFPASQVDTAVGQTVTGVDRQWPGLFAGTHTVFTGFHVPLAGYYLERNDHDGALGSWYNAGTGTPVDKPNIVGVDQSGSMVIDNTQGIHGIPAEKTPGTSRAIYVGFLSAGGLVPGACAAGGGFAVGVSLDGGKTFTCHNIPGAQNARSFTVLSLDNVGNLYAAWADSATQKTYMAIAPAGYKNNVKAPASVWLKPVVVSDNAVKVSIFANIIAGSPGRVAIGYYGTSAPAGTPDLVKPGQGGWLPYVALTTNGLCQADATPCAAPSFHEAKITDKPNQDDNICTAGTACAATMGNRNLADYFDLTIDPQGHLVSVWSDANNATLYPYVKVAYQASGPSLIVGKPNALRAVRGNGIADAAGDAKYPFYGTTDTTSANDPRLDLRGTTVGMKDSATFEVRMKLTSAASLGTLPSQTVDGATPIQQARYVTRWDTMEANGHGHAYYVEATVARGASAPSFGAAEVANGDAITSPTGPTTPYGTDYRPNPAVAATGHITGDTIVIDVPASALGKVHDGERLFDVGSYAILGPTDVVPFGQMDPALFSLPVTVDASPTFDVTLGAEPASRAVTKHPHKPVTKPRKPHKPSVTPPGGALAATGVPVGLGLTGLALIAGAAVIGRRRKVDTV